ncbi:MAG TPA: rhomboid family intramembrane serine protease [Allosphingosinicella sp.]|nr:rhomboid family intramembrane serine protease [Allosphingosinicella sp.]
MRPPENWRTARVTLVIAAVTAAAWILTGAARLDDAAAVWGGFIPIRVGGVAGDEAFAPVFLTPLTATLVHAGLMHLAFNLLIQLFCGRSVETIIGGRQLAILYVAGAYAAAAAQYLVSPSDPTPMIGASGAISAVLGAYSMMFGRNRVKVANPTLALWLNALWLAAAWVVLQLIVGLTFRTSGTANIAVAAHIGGFLAGLLLAKPLLLLRYRTA